MSSGPYATYSDRVGVADRHSAGHVWPHAPGAHTRRASKCLWNSIRRSCGEIHIFSTSRPGGDVILPLTSTLPRAIETSARDPSPPDQTRPDQTRQRSTLALLHTDICRGASVRWVTEKTPEEFAARESDPFRCRFPGGESVLDVNKRLSEAVLEMQRETARSCRGCVT